MSEEENTITDATIPDPLSPETFSFIDALSEVIYPEDTVEIYLNASAAVRSERARAFLSTVDESDAAQYAKVAGLIEKYETEVRASTYTFRLKGVATERLEELSSIAEKVHPTQYKTGFDQNHMPVKVAEPNKEQLLYLNDLVLSILVEQIVAPNGAVDTAPGVDVMSAFRKKAPASQFQKLMAAMGSLRGKIEMFEQSVDDDFLANA